MSVSPALLVNAQRGASAMRTKTWGKFFLTHSQCNSQKKTPGFPFHFFFFFKKDFIVCVSVYR